MTNREAKPRDLTSLIRSCRTRLQAFIRGRVATVEDAEDVYQEIVGQLVRVDTLLRPVEQVGAWLFRAAKNEITDRQRKIKEVPFTALMNDDGPEEEEFSEALFAKSRTPEEESLSRLVWEELDAALADLPKNQRDIFLWTEIDGLSFKDIAKKTGENVNTLLSRKHKAVLYLRDRLRDLYEDMI